MIAGKGNDSIAAKGGDDLLVGGLGDDTYIIGSNSGRDTVIDTQGSNTIRFVDGIGFNDVASGLMKTGADLVLNIAGNTNSVRINNFFDTANTVNKLEFESGGQISAAQLYGAFGVAAPTATQITADILSDNQIDGSSGDDTLVSGAGNDTLTGGAGNDTYVFKRGFGQDSVINADASSSVDVAQFNDVDYSALWLSRSANDLQINIEGSDDQVSIDNWYAGASNQLDEIRVGNAVLQNNQVDQLVSAMASFDVPNGVGSVIAANVKEDLQPVLAAAWQHS
jgi:Ca2+-binding RTX toxin-like protein